MQDPQSGKRESVIEKVVVENNMTERFFCKGKGGKTEKFYVEKNYICDFNYTGFNNRCFSVCVWRV